MKQMNFNAIEVLPSLLDKSCSQTIRKAWDVVAEHKPYYNKPKPPKYKVGEVVELVWDKDSKCEVCFCKRTGMPLLDDCGMCVDCVGTEEYRETMVFCDSFNKHLGKVKITEVFKIEMQIIDSSVYNIYFPDHHLNCGGLKESNIINLAKRDGFRDIGGLSAGNLPTAIEQMFKYLDKMYDLSQPKEFYVYRFNWIS